MLAGLTACAASVPQDLQAGRVRIMSESDYASGVKMDRSGFSRTEGIVVLADVTWPEPVSYGGVHTATWRLFQGNRLLKEKQDEARLVGKPSHILSHISAGSLPAGTYHAALSMDGMSFADVSFQIDDVSFQIAGGPGLATRLSDPECRDAPWAPIKPIRPVYPAFPAAATERKDHGCATVSISLGADGHAADVRVLAEYPPGYGFGDAVAAAAWKSAYPPGHGGETTFLTVRFATAH